MNFEKIKQEINITSYLQSIGCKPQFENDHTARYFAFYRVDSNPSLSVNKSANLWYDHGLGQGGNIIQLVALINNCSVQESARILTEQKESFSFHCKSSIEQSARIVINKIKPLENIALLQYLENRCINILIAKKYCKEAYYSIANKKYFSLAYENDSQGYELRNKYFKGCTHKDITTINNSSDTLQIFEGFVDMLSYATYYGQDLMQPFDTIVLNSLSCIKKAKLKFSDYSKINLYLDNDIAGIKLTKQLLKEFPIAIDYSHLYKSNKDFNDFLMSKNSE